VYTEKCIREREIIITPERGKMEKGNNNNKKKKRLDGTHTQELESAIDPDGYEGRNLKWTNSR
jgi:hypothetical protein